MAKSTGFLGKQHADKTRQKIQVSQIVNRMNKFALGDKDVEMSSNQLRAAEVLLRKSLPDLSTVTLNGDSEAPLVHEVIVKPI